jgi:hypothetical protein
MPRAGRWAIAMAVTLLAFPLGFVLVPVFQIEHDVAVSVASLMSSVAAMPLSVWASREPKPTPVQYVYVYPPPPPNWQNPSAYPPPASPAPAAPQPGGAGGAGEPPTSPGPSGTPAGQPASPAPPQPISPPETDPGQQYPPSQPGYGPVPGYGTRVPAAPRGASAGSLYAPVSMALGVASLLLVALGFTLGAPLAAVGAVVGIRALRRGALRAYAVVGVATSAATIVLVIARVLVS